METNTKAKVADLCRKVKPGASTFYLKEGSTPIKVIRHANVLENNRIDIASVKEELARESLRTYNNLLKANDVLIAVRGPGKIALVPPECEGYSFTAEFIALEINDAIISPKIVAAYLMQPNVLAFLDNKNGGRILRSVNQEDILNLEIEIPEPEKQKYLAELLDLVGEQKAVIASELEKLDELKHAALDRYLGGGSRS